VALVECMCIHVLALQHKTLQKYNAKLISTEPYWGKYGGAWHMGY
jgi:hypothetical protein